MWIPEQIAGGGKHMDDAFTLLASS